MHLKKLRDILKKKTSKTGFSLLLCCLEQIVFFSFHLVNQKCINCINELLFECQSTCYEKAVKVPQKWHQYLRLSLEKKMVRTNTLASQVQKIKLKEKTSQRCTLYVPYEIAVEVQRLKLLVIIC